MGRSIRVAALTAGRSVASARFRVHQYREPLLRHGIDLRVFPARFGAYPPASQPLRPWWLAATLAQRVPAVIRSHYHDVTLVQREMVATLSTLERWTGRPRVFDVDDALWLRQRGSGVRRIARRCDAVICGNAFLADYFSQFHSDVHVIPTAVDTQRFSPAATDSETSAPVIGWTGGSSNYNELYDIEDALADVLAARPEVRLRVLSDRPPSFKRIPEPQSDFVRWSPEVEVDTIRSFTVGVMPLPDTDWSRGKCGYKALLYMSCAVPVVISAIGMNQEVLALGDVGYGVHSRESWRSALLAILGDETKARSMGRNGRRVVQESYSIEALAPRLAGVLSGLA